MPTFCCFLLPTNLESASKVICWKYKRPKHGGTLAIEVNFMAFGLRKFFARKVVIIPLVTRKKCMKKACTRSAA